MKKEHVFIVLILLVGIGLLSPVILEWYIINMLTPIGDIQQIPSIVESPWTWIIG